MSPRLAPDRRLWNIALAVAVLLLAAFALVMFGYRGRLQREIREKMIAREADVLSPVAQQHIAAAAEQNAGSGAATLLRALLPDARREGLLALAIFDDAGIPLQQIPSSRLLVDLPPGDFARLQSGRPIARFNREFPLQQLDAASRVGDHAPVLEVVLPIHRVGSGRRTDAEVIGYVQYFLDGQALDRELTDLHRSVARATLVALSSGSASILAIVGAAAWFLRRAQRTITDRNARLVRANFELTLAAKASALGQITSHLLHGLQGPIAGLRAAMSDARSPADQETWRTAAGYADRLQTLVGETVELLNDDATHTSYQLTGHELAEVIRRRNAPLAEKRGVRFEVHGGFDGTLDSRRGGLVCLIATNLIANAVEATPRGAGVIVEVRNGDLATVVVRDEGGGIPHDIQTHLFEPGRTGRPGGTGLGLAISQLLAKQVGGTLSLISTGPSGTTFSLQVPVECDR